MNLINFTFILTFLTNVFADKYLLTLKDNSKLFQNDIKSFAKEHNLNKLIEIDDLIVYETSKLNYHTFLITFNELFDVELDKKVVVPNPSKSNKIDTKEQLVFIQGPGESHFDIKSEVPWHLSRVTQKNLPLNDWYRYNTTGTCHTNKNVRINTYVVDTGIDTKHSEFEGRAKWLANFADNEDTDCQSHGTHCAGLVGSRHFGVCKDANLFAVKVLDCSGSGSYSSIIKGLEYVYKHHQNQMNEMSSEIKLKSIISMSLGGGYSNTINKVVEKILSYNDLYVVVAAGNEDNDACKVSPASANGAITVMASDRDDNRAYFSNYGKCADLYSPGVDITSTIPNEKHAKYSGTSMATPILAGIINHYLDMFPDLSQKELKAKLLKYATKNHIESNKDNTNNMLVYLNRGI
jgi:cerevisin